MIDAEVLKMIGWVLIAIGMIGALLPILPGPFLIWLGMLIWAWGDNWLRPAWPILVVLSLMMFIGESTDLWVGAASARRVGTSWRAILIATLFGVIGFILFSIPGAIVGPVLGVLLVEWARWGNLRAGLKAAAAYFIGSLFSIVVQLIIGIAMIGIFFLTTR